MTITNTICPVTVVLPAYNAADTVALSILSAVHQSRPPAEIILMDDGSTDNTRAVIEKTLEELKGQTSVKIHFYPFDYNQGVYKLRNFALDNATQPFIAFLDSDDYWHPQKLEIQHAFFEQDPALQLSCHGVVYRAGVPYDLPLYQPGFKPQSKLLKRHRVLLTNIMVTITVMMRKTDKFRFDESKPRGSDMLFWLEVVLSGGKAIWIRETMSFTAKPLYGASGLSGSIWKAEMAHQHNIFMLWKLGYISRSASIALRIFSFLKMIRRYALFYTRKYKHKILRFMATWRLRISPPAGRFRLF